jgi:tetratricopeptide (TPR) repeat protein
VLHRDLKPSNILLGPSGETLVVDWGLARFVHSTAERGLSGLKPGSTDPLATQVTVGVGTLGYTAPEQLSGEALAASAATDIYSLGTILYAVLTGLSPFAAEAQDQPTQVIERIRAGNFARPGRVNPTIDPALEAICLKAMAREPEQRYADAGTLAEDLERALADEPVTAWTEPPRRRLRRWLARNRVLAAAMAIGLLISTLALGGLSVVQSRNRSALQQQAEQLEFQARVLARTLKQSQAAEEAASAAQQRAEAEREKATLNEALAIEAVNKFHQSVAENEELRHNPRLAALRAQLLRDPLPFFQTLRARLLAEANPSLETLARLREATHALALVHRELGDTGEALRLAHGMVDLCQQVLNTHRALDPETNRAWRLAQARSHLALGNLFPQIEHLAERTTHYQQAVDQFQKLRPELAGDPQLEIDLARSLGRLAVVRASLERFEESRELLDQSLALLQPWQDQAPQNAALRDELATLLEHHAFVLDALGLAEEAERQALRARQVLGEPSGDELVSPDFLKRRATQHLNKGVAHRRRKQHREAVAEFRQAELAWQRLCELVPGQNEFEDALRYSQLNLIQQLRQLDQNADTLPIWRELIARQRETIRKSPDVAKFRGTLCELLHSLGHLLQQLGRRHDPRDAFAEALEHAEFGFAQHPHEPFWRHQRIDLRIHLSNFDMELGQLTTALDRLFEVLPLAREAVGSDDAKSADHQLFRNLLSTMASIHEIQDKLELAQGYWAELQREFRSDPELQPLVSALQQAREGTLPETAEDCLQLAFRASEIRDMAVAVPLMAAALERAPELIHDRQRLPGYQAARASLLWAAQQADPSSKQAVTHRRNALSHLQVELRLWQETARQNPEQSAAGLKGWFRDPALVTVRQPARRATLPPDEHAPWQDLFETARQLAESPPPESQPESPPEPPTPPVEAPQSPQP